MGRIEQTLFNLKKLDSLASQTTGVHNINPEIKTVTTLAYILTVVSFGKYATLQLLPLLFYPVFLIYAGNIPPGYIIKKIIILSPFVLLIAIFNLLLDRQILFRFFGLPLSAGLCSFLSILLRFTLTVAASFALIATTGFNQICYALTRLLQGSLLPSRNETISSSIISAPLVVSCRPS